MSATDQDYKDAQEQVKAALLEVMSGELNERIDGTEWMSVLSMVTVQLCKKCSSPEAAGRMIGAAMGTLCQHAPETEDPFQELEQLSGGVNAALRKTLRELQDQHAEGTDAERLVAEISSRLFDFSNWCQAHDASPHDAWYSMLDCIMFMVRGTFGWPYVCRLVQGCALAHARSHGEDPRELAVALTHADEVYDGEESA